LDHPGISTLIADRSHSGQAFNAMTTRAQIAAWAVQHGLAAPIT